jgi:unsaturated chondroitin disaccharide hydrolase
MAPHVSATGVHDHGFNNVSTYGNLHRLMREGFIPANEGERIFYELALKVSGAVQASRWTDSGTGRDTSILSTAPNPFLPTPCDRSVLWPSPTSSGTSSWGSRT